MKMRIAMIATLVTATLVGCGKKGNDSVDENGSCTQSFLDDHNAVTRAHGTMMTAFDPRFEQIYPASERRKRAQDVKTACDSFYAKHGSNTCTANSIRTASDVTAPTAEFIYACEDATLQLARLSKTSSTTPPTTTPKQTAPSSQPSTVTTIESASNKGDSWTATTLLSDELKIRILDAYNINRANATKVLVNGRLGYPEEFNTEALYGAARCFFVNDTNTTYYNDTTFMLKDVKEKTNTGRSFVRTVVLIFEDHAGQILAMGCQNIIGASIKVKDVRDAVKGTLELTVMR